MESPTHLSLRLIFRHHLPLSRDRNLDRRDAPDSFNVMDALLGKRRTARDHLVEQAGALALRQGRWKYIEPGRGPRMNVQTNTELGNDPSAQLYNLAVDPGERLNEAAKHPEMVNEMATTLDRIRKSGGSRSGPQQSQSRR